MVLLNTYHDPISHNLEMKENIYSKLWKSILALVGNNCILQIGDWSLVKNRWFYLNQSLETNSILTIGTLLGVSTLGLIKWNNVFCSITTYLDLIKYLHFLVHSWSNRIGFITLNIEIILIFQMIRKNTKEIW